MNWNEQRDILNEMAELSGFWYDRDEQLWKYANSGEIYFDMEGLPNHPFYWDYEATQDLPAGYVVEICQIDVNRWDCSIYSNLTIDCVANYVGEDEITARIMAKLILLRKIKEEGEISS